jgi:hypothetical protein
MPTSKSTEVVPIFSSEAIRWLVGFIAFSLPILVSIISFTRLTSVSVSYYTGARDVFVGLLFVLGAFLLVYKGHTKTEDWIANLGGLTAIITALFPTRCDFCQASPAAYIHALAGNVLFGVTAYFCLGPFRRAAKGKQWIKAKRRVRFYTICGYSIIACLVILAVIGFTMTNEIKETWTPIYWGEFAILWIFSAAWIVASQWIPWFSDQNKDEMLNLFREFQIRKLDRSQ